MTNRLKAYVRRTMLAAARDYATGNRRTAESTKAAFQDAMRGTDTGWWNDLIYTAPMLQLAHRYRRDIATALAEYRDATGEGFCYRRGQADEMPESYILHVIATARRAFTMAEYQDESEGGPADAMLIGLRFAVEWYAGEVARQYCPDL